MSRFENLNTGSDLARQSTLQLTDLFRKNKTDEAVLVGILDALRPRFGSHSTQLRRDIIQQLSRLQGGTGDVRSQLMTELRSQVIFGYVALGVLIAAVFSLVGVLMSLK